MKFSTLCFLAVQALALCNVIRASSLARNLTDLCYDIPLPPVPISDANRTVPWGQPTVQYPNGTTCCSSLDQVRNALDEIDAQLLQLFSTRAAYVREATRFKSTEASINDPSRNEQVIQGAIDSAPAVHLPQIVAQMVYQSIINSSVLFEECIVELIGSWYYAVTLCIVEYAKDKPSAPPITRNPSHDNTSRLVRQMRKVRVSYQAGGWTLRC